MGTFFEWNDKLSVGIEEIDAQHKVLVNLLNEVHRAVESGDQAGVRATLDELIIYTRTHFAVEESLMRLLHYPDYEEHKAHHEKLVDEVLELKQRVDAGEEKGPELLRLLKTWLTQHIMQEDMQYTGFFIKAGAKPTLKTKAWLGRLFGGRDTRLSSA